MYNIYVARYAIILYDGSSLLCSASAPRAWIVLHARVHCTFFPAITRLQAESIADDSRGRNAHTHIYIYTHVRMWCEKQVAVLALLSPPPLPLSEYIFVPTPCISIHMYDARLRSVRLIGCIIAGGRLLSPQDSANGHARRESLACALIYAIRSLLIFILACIPTSCLFLPPFSFFIVQTCTRSGSFTLRYHRSVMIGFGLV